MLKNFLSEALEEQLWLTAESQSVSSLELESEDSDDDSESDSEEDEDDVPQRRYNRNPQLKKHAQHPVQQRVPLGFKAEVQPKSCRRKSRVSAPNLLGVRLLSSSGLGLRGGKMMSNSKTGGGGNTQWTTNTSAKKAGLSLLNDTRIGGGATTSTQVKSHEEKIAGSALSKLNLKASQVLDISVNVTTVRVRVSDSGMKRRNLSSPGLSSLGRERTVPETNKRVPRRARKLSPRASKQAAMADEGQPALRRSRSCTDPNLVGKPSDRWASSSVFDPSEKSSSADLPILQRSTTEPAILGASKQAQRNMRRRNRKAAREYITKETLPALKMTAASSPSLTNYRRSQTFPQNRNGSGNDRWSSTPKNQLGGGSSRSQSTRMFSPNLLRGMVIDTSANTHTARKKKLSPSHTAQLSSDLLGGMVISTPTSRSQMSSSRAAASNSSLLSLSRQLPDSRDRSGSSGAGNNARWNSDFGRRPSGRRDPSSPLHGSLRPKLPLSSAPNLMSLQQRYSRSPTSLATGQSSNARWSSSSPDALTGRPKLGLEMLTRTNSSKLLNKLPRTSSRTSLSMAGGFSSKIGVSTPNLQNIRRAISVPQPSDGGNAQWTTGSSAPKRPNLSMDLLVAGGGAASGAAVPNSQPRLKSRWNSASVFYGNISQSAASEPQAVSSRAKMGMDLMKATSNAIKSRTPPSRSVSLMGTPRKIGASAPNLLNFKRSTTIPGENDPANALWTSSTVTRSQTRLSMDLLQRGKSGLEAMLDGSHQGAANTAPRWDSGSSDNLSGMSLGTSDQRSTAKLLPRPRRHRSHKKKVRLSSTNVSSGDTPPAIIRRTSTDEHKDEPVTKTYESVVVSALPVTPEQVEEKPAKVIDLVQEVTEMLNGSLLEHQIDGSSPDSVSKAAVSLAALEINRCARMDLRKERSARSLAAEEDSICDEGATCRPSCLGCSETIPEYRSDDDMDYVSVDDTISHGPDQGCFSHTDMHHHHHHDDCVSQLSKEDGHHHSHEHLAQGGKGLTIPVRCSSDKRSRRGSVDATAADDLIHAFMKSMPKRPTAANQPASGPQKPQRRQSREYDKDLALNLPLQYLSSGEEDSHGGHRSSMHGQRKPVRKTSIDMVSCSSSQPQSQPILGSMEDSSADQSSHGASMMSDFNELSFPGTAMSTKRMPDISNLSNISTPIPATEAANSTGKASDLPMPDNSMSATRLVASSKASAMPMKDSTKSSRSSKSSENMFGSITNDTHLLVAGKASAMPMKDASISSRTLKTSGNMFGSITNDVYSMLAAQEQKPKPDTNEKVVEGGTAEEKNGDDEQTTVAREESEVKSLAASVNGIARTQQPSICPADRLADRLADAGVNSVFGKGHLTRVPSGNKLAHPRDGAGACV